MSDSLRPHGLQPARLFYPWDSPGKSAGAGVFATGQSKGQDLSQAAQVSQTEGGSSEQVESASLQGRGLLRPPRLPACATSIVLLPEPENCSPGGILNIHLIYCPLPTAL